MFKKLVFVFTALVFSFFVAEPVLAAAPVLSLSAYNNTQNTDAIRTPAAREDFITYTLNARNAGSEAVENFVFSVDLSQVLPFADVADNGGATLQGNILVFAPVTIPSGSTVTKSFQVRVKYFLSDVLQYTVPLTYGNTVTFSINKGQVKGAFIAPRTGADYYALAFAGLLTAGYAVIKNRKAIMSF